MPTNETKTKAHNVTKQKLKKIRMAYNCLNLFLSRVGKQCCKANQATSPVHRQCVRQLPYASVFINMFRA